MLHWATVVYRVCLTHLRNVFDATMDRVMLLKILHFHRLLMVSILHVAMIRDFYSSHRRHRYQSHDFYRLQRAMVHLMPVLESNQLEN